MGRTMRKTGRARQDPRRKPVNPVKPLFRRARRSGAVRVKRTLTILLAFLAAWRRSGACEKRANTMRTIVVSLAICCASAWHSSAQAERRMFIIANDAAYGVDTCLAKGDKCGAAAANAYCQARQFAAATFLPQGRPRRNHRHHPQRRHRRLPRRQLRRPGRHRLHALKRAAAASHKSPALSGARSPGRFATLKSPARSARSIDQAPPPRTRKCATTIAQNSGYSIAAILPGKAELPVIGDDGDDEEADDRHGDQARQKTERQAEAADELDQADHIDPEHAIARSRRLRGTWRRPRYRRTGSDSREWRASRRPPAGSAVR